ncbi:MAG: HK97 family phage prohead protease [Rhodospirillales bacterium]|nr:HK97 family phage prohead protease [Rhodospirillales bacterium]
MRLEHRHVGEVRAEGRRLSGVVMAYGDVSPTHRERFEPGSLRLADAVHLDLHHDVMRAVAWHPGGGLELRHGRQALTMTATLPPIPAADRALEEVRAGVNGLSVEFKTMRQRRDGDLRVIEDAVLSGIGIVRNPSYGASTVEARRRRGQTLRSDFPGDTRLECRCAGGHCRYAMFSSDMLESALERAMEARKMIATFEDYSRPLASVARGSIRKVGATAVAIDLPQGAAGDAVVDASSSVGVIVRPLPDRETAVTEQVEEDGEQVMVYRDVDLRALAVTPTDARQGWPEAVIEDYPAETASSSAPRRGPRRYGRGRWQR